jgi:hypothetical protein
VRSCKRDIASATCRCNSPTRSDPCAAERRALSAPSSCATTRPVQPVRQETTSCRVLLYRAVGALSLSFSSQLFGRRSQLGRNDQANLSCDSTGCIPVPQLR